MTGYVLFDVTSNQYWTKKGGFSNQEEAFVFLCELIAEWSAALLRSLGLEIEVRHE